MMSKSTGNIIKILYGNLGRVHMTETKMSNNWFEELELLCLKEKGRMNLTKIL